MKRWSRSESRSTVHNHRFTRSLFTGFFAFLPNFLLLFRACLGLGTFGATHERLDPSLRSSTSPILHRAVVGASVPTPFSLSCRCYHLSDLVTRSFQPSLATLKTASPTLSLMHRG
ncbi:hypothetical protein CRG98_001957 [Punica granatum]|uniref:Uncharacterized protein n=1 Tax=Punica granatum TaxID=22663 RepID=A0A2I0LAA4_PUNGR|nr:hypothetical protein CRG98_001957 [Punica granatum]